MFKRAICASSFVLMVSGCAVPETMKGYDGPPLPESAVGLVKPHINTFITQIDGDSTKQASPMQTVGSKDISIALPPGRHSAEVGYKFVHGLGSIRSTDNVRVEFSVEAGHRYVLYPVVLGSKWKPEVRDVTNEPQQWCFHYPRC